jgi:PAS domain S-box-containing protein
MGEPASLIAYRLRTVKVGVQATFVVLIPLVAFLFIPSSISIERPLYIASLIVTAVGAAVVAFLPWERLFERGWGLRFMYAWSILDVLIITAILASVGRDGAPFFVLYGLTTVFAAASYRPGPLVAFLVFTLGSYLTMLTVSDNNVMVAPTIVRFAALAGVALITGFLSSELLVQNERLAREVADRQRAELRLRASESQLEDAQRVAHLGSWEWDIQKNELMWSNELLRIFGVEKGAFEATYDGFISAVHPDDREWVNEVVRRSFEALQPFAFEHRVLRPDGSERVLLARGRVEADDTGEPSVMIGTALDLTEAKKAERAERDFAELADRQQQAMEINDNVVQGLIVAGYSLEANDPKRAGRAIAATLGAARKIVDKLLSGRFDLMKPGDFVRSEPATLDIEDEKSQT